MWRYTAAVLLIGGLFGCVSIDTGPETGGVKPHWGKSYGPPAVPGMQGPYGTPVPMAAPYNSAPPNSSWAATQMMNRNIPMNMVQMNQGGMAPMGGMPGAGMPSLPMPPGGLISPPGMPFTPGGRPGAANLMQTGHAMLPGMGGSGVVPAHIAPGQMPPGGVIQAQALMNPANSVRFPAQRTQVRFVRPTGMRVAWFTVGPDGKPGYSTELRETPVKYNFAQAAIYRLKLSNIEGLPGQDLYPTMEVVPCNPKVEAFLAHSSVPVEFTPEDFKQVTSGNYIVKVIYLPDPQYQDEVGPGLGEIISTRLEPGQDPIQEALRRGSILLIIRMGNVDQEAPNTPPLATPAPAALPPQGMPGGHAPMGPVQQIPYLGMPHAGGPSFGPSAPAIAPPGGMTSLPNDQGTSNFADPRGPGMVPGAPFNVPSLPLAPNGANVSTPNALPALPPGVPTNLPPLNNVPPVGADPSIPVPPATGRVPASLTGATTPNLPGVPMPAAPVLPPALPTLP